MILKSDKLRLKKMISDSIAVLCRAGLQIESKFQIDALIGITLDDDEVVLVSFKETMASNGVVISDNEADNEEKETDGENFDAEHTKMSLTEIPQCLEWEPSSDYTNHNGNHYQDSQRLSTACHESGDETNTGSNKRRRQNKRKSRERDIQPTSVKYEPFDTTGSFQNTEYEQEFTDSKLFQGDFNIPSDVTNDDCIIVKSEEDSGANEFYELGEQLLQEQINAGHADDYSNFQAADSMKDLNDLSYSQESTRIPRLSHTSKKLRLPAQQRHQPHTSKSNLGFLKSKCAQLSVKLSKDSQSADNEELEDSFIGRAVMQCAYCDAVFNRSHVLKEHVNGVHFKKKMFHCPDCGESFKWRAELSRHRRVPGLCPCSGFQNSEWPS